ncbi:hypothetical protein CHGG_00796 [Chaetomium globosum CBS 148.51]|uniref:N(6)-L-threonylcarbamoyladenine synthase n=1 Tax=Chaetomium globosum (strain ATCC 6205 / CBS 148.51 / DSM 1962 / NBRC 6347 / NRRL 1970) TaxID=306901 RepID=Q2HG58_CHAGB|nr:uncharacterized protein CHGG_00796 [Chaetomium globosum CBS 148.51]EAQ92561.1 hypothetical protein CHGG_00796 [Chaetomium globosum CBS 148.51]
MSDLRALQPGPSSRISSRTKDDWEDWEDDEVLTPMTTKDGPLLDSAPGKVEDAREAAAGRPELRASRRVSGVVARPSIRAGLGRLASRKRQKAQNERAGIKLVTDMSKFQQQKHQQRHIAHHMRTSPENRESRTGKFVDAAALKALEGVPSDESIGTFAWLTRRPTKGKRIERLVAESSPQADLSPGARPIMIGFEMPSDSDVVISPQTAVVETPIEFPRFFKPTNVTSPSQPVSAWSPDTEDGASPRMVQRGFVPAVPSIPSHYRVAEVSPVTASDHDGDAFSAAGERRNHRDTATTPIYVSDNDDEMATPVTLFEEDGSPRITQRKSFKYKGRPRSGTGGSLRSTGWWDQVTSPFGPPTPRSPASIQTKPDEGQSWWKNLDKKKAFSPVTPMSEAGSSSGSRNLPRTQHHQPPEIIIEDMSSSFPSSSRAAPTPPQPQPESEKPRGMIEEVQTPGEQPPPYSPPSKNNNARYRAVFPPGHPLNSLYPPSPGPVPPGLSQTMTSQGAINLSDVPLTPPPTQQRLPDRPLGSFVPGEHFTNVSGHGQRQKVERQRRRHEKEDAVAWKAGRMWHGRGCFPCCGCFGRPGREGRKRRRICLAVLIAFILLTALGVTLGVLLSRQSAAAEEIIPSRFLNLTDFPPIPTGISTVIGPESDSTTACVQPPTLWTCALPKEQADSVAPFDASQPSFVIQIQFDNNTRKLWNVAGDAPRPTPTDPGVSVPLPRLNESTTTKTTATPTTNPRAVPVTGFTSLVRHLLRKRDDSGSSLALRSEPPPPSFQEMFFLGNTTDGVVSDDKAGEPTPFYISMLRSINDTVGPNTLTRRDDDDNFGQQTNITAGQGLLNASDIAPPPALDRDGTGAPAVLLAFPTQQPLRLYDRGLPTERYGFYSYYNKTTYVKSIDPLLDNSAGDGTPVPADRNGGALKTEAKFLVTWLSVRYKVEIWTRLANTTRLTGAGNTNDNSTQPGSFPYPVTVTLDTHGGERGRKFAFVRGVDDRQRIVLDDARFVLNRMNTTGDLVNGAGEFNPSFGGMDGGSGGSGKMNLIGGLRKFSHKKDPGEAGEKGLVTLAIETSCDDTCVTVLEKSGDAARVLFNAKVTSDNRRFGGIKPDEAVQGHSSSLPGIVQAAIQKLPADRPKPDFISVTRGPGITSALSIGLTMAKGLAVAWDRPLVAVHHMQAHALTPRLVEALANGQQQPPHQGGARPAYPFLSLLVSGGHSQLLLTRSAVSHATLAEAANVAIGDMLDKCARAILPSDILASTPDVMYAAELERFAFAPTPTQTQTHQTQTQHPSNPYTNYHPPTTRRDEIRPYTSPTHGWTLTPPLHERRDMAFDFSGLGGQVQAIMQRNPSMDPPQRAELARETMRVAFEHLASRVIFALDGMRTQAAALPVRTLVVSGGVAANGFLMHVLGRVLAVRGYGPEKVAVVRPPRGLCTDNAVMVAWAGVEMWEAGWESELSVLPRRRWEMDDGWEGVEDPEGVWRERYRRLVEEGGEGSELLETQTRAAEDQQVSKTQGILGLDGWRRRFPDAETLWREAAAKLRETEKKM